MRKRRLKSSQFVRTGRGTTGRNGVTLLFVISIIVLFLLMGTAFVVVSSKFSRSVRRQSILEVHRVDQTAILETAMLDLLRGPVLTDQDSPLRGHSLLADMYGYGVMTSLVSATADTSEHFIRVGIRSNVQAVIDQAPVTLAPVPGSLTGQILTLVSGPAQGLSARIVDHQVSGDTSIGFDHEFVLLPHWKGTGLNESVVPLIGNDRVIINGRPFAGSGAGFLDLTAGRTAPALSMAALQPNQSGRSLDAMLGVVGNQAAAYLADSNGPNSAATNEPYDTFNEQNMFLAGLASGTTIPSFHRQSLVDQAPGDRTRDFRANPMAETRGDKGVQVDNNNDGQPDGIWLDIGLANVTTATGQTIKPLVSYLVLDMESRANVNVHGSAVALDASTTTHVDLLGALPASQLPRGQGLGPADIQLEQVLPGNLAATLIRSRYGVDQQPGVAGVEDDWAEYHLFGLPPGSFADFIPATVGGLYGSLLDIHGRYATGYPDGIFDVFARNNSADANNPDLIPIGMPTANVGISNLAFESVDSPYEFSLATDPFYGPQNFGSDDRPFTVADFERLLRPNDHDSTALPDRLSSMVPLDRQLIATHSFEVPTSYERLPERLYAILDDTIPGTGAVREQRLRDEVLSMMPAEVLRGLPMNVNRSFGDGRDNNGNGVTDEPGENNSLAHPTDTDTPLDLDLDNDALVSGDTDADGFRDAFMRQLYVLTLLVTERKFGSDFDVATDWFDFDGDGVTDNQDLLQYRRRIAQWVVNVVDFRDPDSIMTGFECDLEPWDGWDLDGDLSTDEGTNRFVVWGAERPELLITETFAAHDTRQQDTSFESVASGSPTTRADTVDPDDDFDSHLVPKVMAFFELYNPWIINDANQIRPAELYDAAGTGVDLQKTSVFGQSPVWRLVVTVPNDPTTNEDERDFDPDASGVPPSSFQRRIYFARPPRNQDQGFEVYFPDNFVSRPLAPGGYGVVGTAGQEANNLFNNYFGRRSIDPLNPVNLANQTRRISLDPDNQRLELLMAESDGATVTWVPSIREMTVLPINLNDTGFERDLGVSDPVEGYFEIADPNGGTGIELERIEDGLKFVETASTGASVDFAYDTPVDQLAAPDHYEQFLRDRRGLQPGYRVVHLQRLANPLMPWEADSNPYRTIDSASIDLFVFNGVEPTVDREDPVLLATTERRQVENTTETTIQENQHRTLFGNSIAGNTQADQQAQDNAGLQFNGLPNRLPNDGHFLAWNLIESFGRINDSYREAVGTAQQPFSALVWNNRPFVSQFELTEVPFLSSFGFSRRFGNADRSRDLLAPSDELAAGFDLLSAQFPYLLSFYADRVTGETNGPALHRLMDFTEVPSRFLGTESFVNPVSFIDNLNGLSFGLAPPFDRISSHRYPGKVNINTVLDSRVWDAIMSQYAMVGLGDSVTFDAWQASRRGAGTNTDFDNPLRPAYAFNLVGPGGLNSGQLPVDSGLFRTDGNDPPLFDYAPELANKLPALDVDRAAQIRLALRERMGNLVTNRSSVFAIWITTGYFEVDAGGNLVTNGNSLQEFGAASGAARRGRAFYLIDRSVPVAFEPGRDHNVQRAIVRRSLIEHGSFIAR